MALFTAEEAQDWFKTKGSDLKKAADPGISWSETKESFAPEVENLAAMREFETSGYSPAQFDAAIGGYTEDAGKLIAAQRDALEDPSAVGEQDARSIKQAQAIAGEGAKEIAGGLAQVSAEMQGLSEEKERGERDWKSSEIQRMLANIAAFREMSRARKDEVFATMGGLAKAALGSVGEGD